MCVYIWLKNRMKYFFSEYILLSFHQNKRFCRFKKRALPWDLPSLKDQGTTPPWRSTHPSSDRRLGHKGQGLGSKRLTRDATWCSHLEDHLPGLGSVTVVRISNPPNYKVGSLTICKGNLPQVRGLTMTMVIRTTYPSPGMIRLVANLRGSCYWWKLSGESTGGWWTWKQVVFSRYRLYVLLRVDCKWCFMMYCHHECKKRCKPCMNCINALL